MRRKRGKYHAKGEGRGERGEWREEADVVNIGSEEGEGAARGA